MCLTHKEGEQGKKMPVGRDTFGRCAVGAGAVRAGCTAG